MSLTRPIDTVSVTDLPSTGAMPSRRDNGELWMVALIAAGLVGAGFAACRWIQRRSNE